MDFTRDVCRKLRPLWRRDLRQRRQPRIESSAFISNEATYHGGAIYGQAGLTLSDLTFSQNRVGQDGGGLYNNADAIMNRLAFADNLALRFGGGMFQSVNLASLPNASFLRNSAQRGCGLAVGQSGAISDASFYGNTATQLGGGIWAVGGPLSVLRSSFTANRAATYGGGIYI